MSNFNATLTDLVILAAATTSRVVEVAKECADANYLTIYAPAVLAETVTIQVSKDGVTFAALHTGVADVITPLAGKARVYTELSAVMYFRLVAGVAVAADRTFQVSKNYLAER
jgi:hypothetical protein